MGAAYCGGCTMSHKGSMIDQNMTAPATPEQKIMAIHEDRGNSGFSSGSPNLMSPYRLHAKYTHRTINPTVIHR